MNQVQVLIIENGEVVASKQLPNDYLVGFAPITDWPFVGDDARDMVVNWLRSDLDCPQHCHAVLMVDGVRYDNTLTLVEA